MSTIAVLIPCFNEAETIGKVVRDYRAALPNADIYVFDNNSTDKTGELAEKAGAVVRHEYRQGKGNVIRSMFREVNADCYLMTDGDDTYPAENAPELVRMILEKKADMVNGDRLSSTYFQENKRPFHNFGNRMVRGLINRIFGTNVRDIMTGYRAFSPGFVKNFPILSHGFEIETEMTIFAVERNFVIREIPVAYRDRPSGSVSKLNTCSDGLKVLRTILRLFQEYRPFAFFGILALLFLLAAILCMVPVLREYFTTGLVPRFPTLIVGTSLGICSLLSFFSGVILSVIVKQRSQATELLMNLYLEVNRHGKER
ncbi:MAG: glycosyltransferase family 2 protein [Oscillospiraceae bacterium]|jgi:glycosyltransferase involved in cell wall biosynthesis|nr:glycosyltransferase family 2 protein [Oscillospiraceae bacterium]MCI2034767.1 glycosyltransferase family 2 protein [Oscillospiraceae bacterium]